MSSSAGRDMTEMSVHCVLLFGFFWCHYSLNNDECLLEGPFWKLLPRAPLESPLPTGAAQLLKPVPGSSRCTVFVLMRFEMLQSAKCWPLLGMLQS